MAKNQEFKVNFFRPLSDHARANKKVIVRSMIIWAIAVFGFQILLIVLNNPTPEEAYNQFNAVWPGVVEDSLVTTETQQQFSQTLLSVLGKNIVVKDDHKIILKEALSWSVYKILPDSVNHVLKAEPNGQSVKLAKAAIGLKNEGFDKIMVDLLPTSLVKVESEELSDKTKSELPNIMELYLVHNRSVLTNFNFIGFPFHYWYTAQFLLILFVILCLVYAITLDRINRKYDFVEES